MYPFDLVGHERNITCLRFNYDGDVFFSGAAERKINLWEAFTGERLGSFATKASVRSFDVDINCKHLIMCSNDGTLQMFDAMKGTSLALVRLDYKLKQIEFDYGCNKFLLIADSYDIVSPSTIILVDFKQFISESKKLDQGDEIRQSLQDFFARQTSFSATVHGTNKPSQKITKALWYVDGQSLFTSTEHGYIVKFSLSGAILAKELIHENHCINNLAFSPDFSILATAANNGAKIVDPETLTILRIFKQELPMNTIAISPLFCDQKKPKYHMIMGGGVPSQEAAGSHKAGLDVHVCNIMYGSEVCKIGGHYGTINAIEFFKDGRGYVSGGEEGKMKVVRFPEQYFEDNNSLYE